jgi:hypothetical protein
VPWEVPKHNDLDLDVVKAYCEQTTPITGRKLYNGPVSFEPMGLLTATSNYPATVADVEDDGYARRARVLCTKKRFLSRPKLLTEQKADPTLKPLIQTGHFNHQLLYLAIKLLPTLDKEICGGTNIEPMPPCVAEAVGLQKQRASAMSGDPKKWIEEHTEPVERVEATGCVLDVGAAGGCLERF